MIPPKKTPMPAQRDPLEEIRPAERAQEDVYFRKVDLALIAALRQKSVAEAEERIKKYTSRRCPK